MIAVGRVFLLVTLLLCSCSGKTVDKGLAAFCVFGLNSQDHEPLYFDLDERVAFSSDTKSSLEPIQQGDYVGFLHPFPVMIPRKELLLSGKTLEWEADGGSEWGADRYSFVSAPESRTEPKWFLITATEIDDPDVPERKLNRNTTVLYSLDSGVVAIRQKRQSSSYRFENDLYLCSETKLDPLELAGDLR